MTHSMLNNNCKDVSQEKLLLECCNPLYAKTFLNEVLSIAKKNHATPDEYLESFKIGRLLSLVIICDLTSNDTLVQPARELLSLISKEKYAHCPCLCCKWDVAPLVFRQLCDKKVPLTPDLKNWTSTFPLEQCEKIEQFVSAVEEFEKHIAKITGEEATEPPQKQARRQKKKVSDLLFDVSHSSALWTQVRRFFSFPTKAVSVGQLSSKPPKLLECVDLPDADDKLFRPTCSDVPEKLDACLFAVVSGTLPPFMESKFARDFLCILSDADDERCLFSCVRAVAYDGRVFLKTQESTVQCIVMPDIIDMGRFDDSLCPPSTPCDISYAWIFRFTSFSHMMCNYGLNVREPPQTLVEKLPKSAYQFVLYSLVEHVGKLERLLKEKNIPLLSGDVYEDTVVNPFFVLTPNNVRYDRHTNIVKIVPCVGQRHRFTKSCLPSSLIAKRANKHRILCNNLARFIYLAVTNKPLPEIGDEDDEDGLARTRFAREASSMTADGELLTSSFMHMILCLWFGDCDLLSIEFRQYAMRAFTSIKDQFEEVPLTFQHEVREVRRQIVNEDFSRSIHFNKLELAAPEEGADWVYAFFKSAADFGFAHFTDRNFPALTLKDQVAVGNGPHRELLVKILIDLCNHSGFPLTIDTDRRALRLRKSANDECLVCKNPRYPETWMVWCGSSTSCIVSRGAARSSPESFSDMAIWVALQSMLESVNFPATFSISAIGYLLGCSTKKNFFDALLCADHGEFSAATASWSFSDRKMTCPDLHPYIGHQVSNSLSCQVFPSLRSVFADRPLLACMALYHYANSVPFESDLPDSTTELDEKELRIMCISLLDFGNLREDFRVSFNSLMLGEGRPTSLEELENFERTMYNTLSDPEEHEKMQNFIALCRKMVSMFVFVKWLMRAEAADLEKFLAIVGSSVEFLRRCRRAYFARYHSEDRLSLVRQILLEFCNHREKSETPFSARFFQEDASHIGRKCWLDHERIKVTFENTPHRLPTVSTCVRKIQLPLIVCDERVDWAMKWLLDNGTQYNET